MSHYETLDVPKDADATTIKRAYRKKSREAHPDRASGDNTRMVAINRAYETLGNAEKRKRYDATGEDVPTPSLDTQAMNAVMQLFTQLLESCEESEDIVDSVRSTIRENQSRFKQQQAVYRAAIGSLEKRRKKLKHKGGARNFLDDLLVDRIRGLTQQIASFEQSLALGERALEMLKDYQYEAERRPRAPQQVFVASFSQWGPG